MICHQILLRKYSHLFPTTYTYPEPQKMVEKNYQCSLLHTSGS